MKTLKEKILEKLTITKDSKISTYNSMYKYHPKSTIELRNLVVKLIKTRGNDANLNDIDTSAITDMGTLFAYSKFDGDISEWDVSNVEDMHQMFFDSDFSGDNGDISNWDVINVKNMYCMFSYSHFSRDISKWDVSNVKDMTRMFYNCPAMDNPPKWYHN